MTRSDHPGGPGRRRFLAAMSGMAVAAAAPSIALAHAGHAAPVSESPAQTLLRPDRPVARLRLRMAGGGTSELRTLVDGQVTAVQLMFTGCGTTCLMQGALFAALQERLAGQSRDRRLLSISIDALGDDPKVLAAWLGRFGAQGARWTACVPSVEETDRLLSEFSVGSSAINAAEHLNRVFIVDAGGFLRVVTSLDPSADQVMRAMDLGRG
ncbi:SCO family protein [Variovorax sp. dw_308]|uniref:SCO family protein n=1 Tax=Variovorax sp. dw_308 TaxID=2721546 RepID=UPI001C47AE3A|nr:SCO family protein [Variovorax sp. dw_308]